MTARAESAGTRWPSICASLVERWKRNRWHYRRSLASRVTLLTTFAVAFTVVLLTAGAYVTVRMQLQSILDESLLERAHAAAHTGALEELTAAYPLAPWALGAADVRIMFITEQGDARLTDRLPPLDLGAPELAVAAGEVDHTIRTLVDEDGAGWRVAAVPTVAEGQALVIAQSLESHELVLKRLGIAMGLFGLAGVVAAGVAGWAVARNGLRPVRRLTAAVEGVARTEDLRPLQVEGDDEVARLAQAFNSMLAALSASRDRQRQLVADASHELRTPLTSLRTNIDLLIQADRDDADEASGPGGAVLAPESRAELLADVRDQAAELTTLVGDLVELARDEPPRHGVEPLDLQDLVDRALRRVRPRANRVTFHVDTDPWWVIGEPATLERAITNLLDNAVKWSPTDGTVQVELHEGVLTVDDEGPGIDEADRPQVFDRFYRSATARTMSGSGLGLAIVRQAAERHTGSVEVSSAPGGGARLTMRLPGSRTRPDGME